MRVRFVWADGGVTYQEVTLPLKAQWSVLAMPPSVRVFNVDDEWPAKPPYQRIVFQLHQYSDGSCEYREAAEYASRR